MELQPDTRYPKVITFITSAGFQVVLTLLTLGLVIYYNLSYFLYVPMTGVWLDYENEQQNSAVIDRITPGSPAEQVGLQVGDKVISIDGREITNLNVPIHQPKKAGEFEMYVVEREGQTLTIPLQVGSYADHPQDLVNIIPLQLLSLSIYLLGVILLFFSFQPDVRARLVALVWILAGVALAATGPGYISCAWFAPNVAMLTFGFSIFISTAAHLYFPATTFSNRTRNIIIWSLFGLSMVLMAAYLAQQIYFAVHQVNPATSLTVMAVNIPFYLLWLVNIGLLIKNRFFVQDKEIRRQTNIILLGTLLGFLPFLLFSEIPALLFGPDSKLILLPSTVSILALVLIPISYGYVIYQRRLLKIDFIINRALVLFLLILNILFVSLTVLGLVSRFASQPAQIAIAGGLLCVLAALGAAVWQKQIQTRVDRALYGGYYDYMTVTSDLSNRLAQTIDRPTFVNLLSNDLPGMMKIDRSALMMMKDGRLELQPPDDPIFSIPLDDQICKRMAAASGPLRTQNVWNSVSSDTLEHWKPFAWAQLFVPIVHRDTLYGVLLLGDRATGNIYSNQDLQIIGTVGQQAALSIANIAFVEALRGLAQELVRSDEEQRKKVARDLHDSVLQSLFFAKQRLARSDQETATIVDQAITMLRQTIKAQRPSLLDRGLILALQDLIGEMEQLAADDLVILWHNYLEEDIVLTDEKATSIYRIVQESLTNILKHARADRVVVTARKDNDTLVFQIEDNGIGISGDSLAQIGHHYGLLGMVERATMIGATLNIASTPGKGSTVTVKVKLKNASS